MTDIEESLPQEEEYFRRREEQEQQGPQPPVDLSRVMRTGQESGFGHHTALTGQRALDAAILGAEAPSRASVHDPGSSHLKKRGKTVG